MSSKVHNTIFLVVFAVSVILILLMKKGSLMMGYFAIIPYLLVFISLWLLLSINMLKTAMKNLHIMPTDKRAETFAMLLRKSFAVETFVKKEDLKETYSHVTGLRQVSYETKVKLYEAFDRKSIYVPYPAQTTGKKNKKSKK